MAKELLDAYLSLERLMLRLDPNSLAAESIRDTMDPLWHQLDASDREYLNKRSIEDSEAPINVDDAFLDTIEERVGGDDRVHSNEVQVPLEELLIAS